MRLGTLGWTMGLGATALLLAGLGWGLNHAATQAPKTLVGQVAPDLTIQRLEGGELKLSSLGGSPLVVNFWASWCAPCRQEAPVLNAAAVEYSGRVKFVGLDIQDSDQGARA